MTGYSGERWRKARQAVMARDNGRCQGCGAAEDLHAHHITPSSDFDTEEDAHYLANLVVLCKYCHPEWEGESARPVLVGDSLPVRLDSVLAELTIDTLLRESVASDCGSIYVNWIKPDPQICDRCHAKIASYGLTARGRYRETLRSVVRSDSDFGSGAVVHSDRQQNRQFCERCRGSPVFGARSLDVLLKHGEQLCDRLYERGVPFERQMLLDVLKHRNSQPDYSVKEHDNFAVATECAAHLAMGRETNIYHTPPQIYTSRIKQ